MKKHGDRRSVRLASIVWIATFAVAFALAVGAEDALFQVRVGRVRDTFAVVRAIEAAARRLEHPRCHSLLSDFRGADGRTLAEVLTSEGLTAPGHLRRLFFYSGEDHRRCRKGVLAFTTPGSRVVYVCAARFREGYSTNPARLEAVILHEMLHTLGLGEDPPMSQEITAQVVAACFG
jgi:hypothetical protein